MLEERGRGVVRERYWASLIACPAVYISFRDEFIIRMGFFQTSVHLVAGSRAKPRISRRARWPRYVRCRVLAALDSLWSADLSFVIPFPPSSLFATSFSLLSGSSVGVVGSMLARLGWRGWGELEVLAVLSTILSMFIRNQKRQMRADCMDSFDCEACTEHGMLLQIQLSNQSYNSHSASKRRCLPPSPCAEREVVVRSC